MKKWIGYIFISFLMFLIACSKDELSHGTVSDIDGNTYRTVIIGEQEWMAENLRTTKYRNGIAIPNIVLKSEWNNITSGASCVYEKALNSPVNVKVYGRLYNFFAVIDENQLAPIGWHVATAADWQKLLDFYGGEYDSGEKLKDKNIFNVIFGGCLVDDFVSLNDAGFYWSSTEDDNADHLAYRFSINSGPYFFIVNGIKIPYPIPVVQLLSINKKSGLSIRCVKD